MVIAQVLGRGKHSQSFEGISVEAWYWMDNGDGVWHLLILNLILKGFTCRAFSPSQEPTWEEEVSFRSFKHSSRGLIYYRNLLHELREPCLSQYQRWWYARQTRGAQRRWTCSTEIHRQDEDSNASPPICASCMVNFLHIITILTSPDSILIVVRDGMTILAKNVSTNSATWGRGKEMLGCFELIGKVRQRNWGTRDAVYYCRV